MLHACGPMAVARYLTAVDDIGIPKVEYRDVTAAQIIEDLLDRCGSQLADLGAGADGTCYDTDQLDALDDQPLELLLENYPLPQALLMAIEDQDVGMIVDAQSLIWQFHRLSNLPEMDFQLGDLSGRTVLVMEVNNDIRDRFTAVKLHGPRSLSIAGAESELLPAWDSQLEASWSWPHRHYTTANSGANDYCWVYRRFSYADVDDLLEDQPVQLLQQIRLAGGSYTLVPVDILPLDTDNKYVVACYPLVETPAGHRVNFDIPAVPGQAGPPNKVILRYRKLAGISVSTSRYPSSGFAGALTQLGGLEQELAVYLPDIDQVTQSHARSLWTKLRGPNLACKLKWHGQLPTELINLGAKLRLWGVDFPHGPLPALPLRALEHNFDSQITTLWMASQLDR